MNIRKRNTNSGIQLLRFFLSLWIVIVHCTDIKKNHMYWFIGINVPTFVLMSSYFYYPALETRQITKIYFRFQRLLIPYILWPILILVLNNILTKAFSFSQFDRYVTLKDLFTQIILGNIFHQIFWFQFNLIFVTLLFTIISFIFKRNLSEILQLFGILSLYLNISHIWYNFFRSFSGKKIFTRFLKTYSITSLNEFIPLSSLGSTLSSINILEKIKNKEFILFYQIIMLSLLYMLFKYHIFVPIQGFRYSNSFLYMSFSTILFLLFGSLQSEESIIVNVIFTNLGKFSGGIYYIHTLLYDYLSKKIYIIHSRTFISSIVIYFICYLICFVGNKIFKNNKLK